MVLAPSLCHLYLRHSLPLPYCPPCGHSVLLSWRRFIIIASSTLPPFNLVAVRDGHCCGVLSLSASTPLCDHYWHHFLGSLLFASGSISMSLSKVDTIIVSLSSSISGHCQSSSYPFHHPFALVVCWLLFWVVGVIIAAAVLLVCGNGSHSSLSSCPYNDSNGMTMLLTLCLHNADGCCADDGNNDSNMMPSLLFFPDNEDSNLADYDGMAPKPSAHTMRAVTLKMAVWCLWQYPLMDISKWWLSI